MNNFISIVGYTGQDPVSKRFSSGKTIVKFSMAVRDHSNSKTQSPPLWIDVQAWNGLGDRVSEHITKGREVVVQGRLALDRYTDKDGRDVTKPVINLISFHLCGKKSATAELVSEKRGRKTKVG